MWRPQIILLTLSFRFYLLNRIKLGKNVCGCWYNRLCSFSIYSHSKLWISYHANNGTFSLLDFRTTFLMIQLLKFLFSHFSIVWQHRIFFLMKTKSSKIIRLFYYGKSFGLWISNYLVKQISQCALHETLTVEFVFPPNPNFISLSTHYPSNLH